ncbi:MAG: hypothetical protein ABIR73_00175 [Usitatibacter sp.]
MTTLYAALSGALLLGAATLAPAQKVPSEAGKMVTPKSMENKTTGISKDEYKMEHERIEADAKAAKAMCKDMKGNTKDICQAEAKGKEKLAKKELDYKKNPNEKNMRDVEKMKAEVAYEIAKEKCEDQKGAGMMACKKQAKEEKDRAMSAAKGKKMADATPVTHSTTPTSMAPHTTPSTSATTKMPSNNPSGPSTVPSASSAGTSGTVDAKQNKSGK